MFEASKTKKTWGPQVKSLLKGKGLDIGCGPDPIDPSADRFDLEQGDANQITKFVSKKYDYVFSSHCLEHMNEPIRALKDWCSLVEDGGHIILIVPDEDLYEQGHFPSLFNEDHKVTFTISKKQSWSKKSINILDMIKEIPDMELASVELQDQNFDRSLLGSRPSPYSKKLWKKFLKYRKFIKTDRQVMIFAKLMRFLGATIDQTCLPGERLAQIQIIMRKLKIGSSQQNSKIRG